MAHYGVWLSDTKILWPKHTERMRLIGVLDVRDKLARFVTCSHENNDLEEVLSVINTLSKLSAAMSASLSVFNFRIF